MAGIEAIARAVRADMRDELVDFCEWWRAHQSGYPRFTASAAAAGCGPIIAGQPLTPRQEAYVCEHEAFEASGVLPAWEQREAALVAERLELHDRALGHASEGEAGDLLEDQQHGHSVEQSPAAAQPIAAPDNADARPGLLPPSAPPRGQDELHQAASTMRRADVDGNDSNLHQRIIRSAVVGAGAREPSSRRKNAGRG